MEEIVKSAIRYENKIYTGFDHGQCFTQLPQGHKGSEIEQGFITNEGRFVDRKEAMKIAKNSGQITYDLGKETLISEDLHIYWLNQQNKESQQLKEELKKYKSYKTDDERIKDLTGLYEKYTTENQQLKQQLKEYSELGTPKEIDDTYKSRNILNNDLQDANRIIDYLVKQLHDLPKKIVDEIKDKSIYHECCGCNKDYEPYYEIDKCYLDTILKKYGDSK